MQTAGIVAISLFAGALFIVLLAGMATIIWLQLRLERIHKEQRVTQATLEIEMKALVEGAKSSFATIRNDVKTAQSSQDESFKAIVKRLEESLEAKLGSINGASLHAASVRGIQAATRMEEVAKTIQSLLVTHTTPNPEELAPEEYAPSETIYHQMNSVARGDQAVAVMEAADMTPLFSNVEY